MIDTSHQESADGSQTQETDLRELLKEAADSANDEYGPEAAVAWAGGYTFPSEYVQEGVACLEAAQGYGEG